ncbi:MAG: winged helix-turn-helix transcriptional regulator [Comamonadaceae bacterium]|uniref:MarR family winged helix-turn-helix transcriptional regulator n=1 Tax=Candidatus Skiveiella danica TaxID=3386177 RepID=UPI00390998C2|nr:winged helix-turn-helix transcriptional regulator [Comamonadaceae bacterium]
MSTPFDFEHAPGHLVRRAHQLAVALFMEETAAFEVTPVQFAILNALIDIPGEDQVTLAARVAFDAATSGSVIGRLEARGWIRREVDPKDKRRKLLWVTAEGERAVARMKSGVARVQQRLMAPLSEPEQAQLVDLLARLVAGHDAAAPPRSARRAAPNKTGPAGAGGAHPTRKGGGGAAQGVTHPAQPPWPFMRRNEIWLTLR